MASFSRAAAGAVVLLLSLITPVAKSQDPPAAPTPVKITLFKMSRCPDAQSVETEVFDGVMARVHEIAEVDFAFIANGQGRDVTCKHGPRECKGNVQQLCVQNYAGKGDGNYHVLWQFVLCQDQRADEIGDVQLADDCIDAVVPDEVAEDARRCIDGWEGLGLLRGSVERTKGLGVTRSLTIFVEDKLRCIHDGDEWYDCDGGSEEQDFVDSICDAYLAKNDEWPDVCGDQAARAQRVEDKKSKPAAGKQQAYVRDKVALAGGSAAAAK